MSENNYGALMMKSSALASENIDLILTPGIYPIPAGNSSSPDNTGGILIVYSGAPARRSFSSDSVVTMISTYNNTTSTWSQWNKPLLLNKRFADIKSDGAAAVAEAISNLGLRDVAHSEMESYLVAGTFTFTVPDGVYRIKCRVIGGGGGAGGSASAKSGGGGGAGGYAEGWIDVTPGQTITITVGAGGQGGTAGNFGTSGGLSSVGGFMSASGGGYGDAGGGGTGAGGFGGTGTGGKINSVGSDGSDGTTNGAAGGGTGGGSLLGGATRSGGTGRNSLSIGGGGAACYLLNAQSGGNGHAGAVILEY